MQVHRQVRRDAVKLVRTSGKRSPRSPATRVSTTPLWAAGSARTVSTGGTRRREGLTTAERARLRELETEYAKLRMEHDLLKRSLTFWLSG